MRYFTISELTRSETANKMKLKNEPNAVEKASLERLVDNVLDPLREAYGKPIYVNSGYRCQALNKAVGGAKTSQHLSGQAADITTGSVEGNKVLFDLVKKLKLPFDQLISEKTTTKGPTWIHVSFRSFKTNRNQILYL